MDVCSQIKHSMKFLPEGVGKLDKVQSTNSHHDSRIELGLGSPVQHWAPGQALTLHRNCLELLAVLLALKRVFMQT